MKLNYIELKCSNGEIFRIDGQYIGKFYAMDIHESMERPDPESEEIDQITKAKRFALEIRKEADRPYTAPTPATESFFIDIYTCQTLFERLRRVSDITHVTVNMHVTEYVDKFKTIAIPFSGRDYNEMEKAEIGKSGNLYISVACPLDEIVLNDAGELPEEQMSLNLAAAE